MTPHRHYRYLGPADLRGSSSGEGRVEVDRVARTQKCAEIRLVLGPQRRRQQMVPTPVGPAALLTAQLGPGPHPYAGHPAAGRATPFPAENVMPTRVPTLFPQNLGTIFYRIR